MRLDYKLDCTFGIDIDTDEAKVLFLLTSFDLANWFYEKCSHEMELSDIKNALQDLHARVGKMLKIREKAMETLLGSGLS